MEWINITASFPEVNTIVLCYLENETYEILKYLDEGCFEALHPYDLKYLENMKFPNVTHWAILPSPPNDFAYLPNKPIC